jgi:MFS family permease
VVLLPAKLSILDAHNQPALLGIVSVVGSIVALVANVVFGALSDRTRSRFGARTGWILAGGIGMSAAVVLVSATSTFATFLLAWCVMQVFLNMYLAPMTAVIADRVAPRRQGLVSAVSGVSASIAQMAGAVIGGSFVTNPNAGFLVFSLFPVVFATLFVLLAPDTSNRDVPKPRLTGQVFLDTFTFPRKGARDFYWAFVGRLLLVVGYFMVVLFQLNILSSYIGLGSSGAGRLIQIQGVIGLVTGIVAGFIAGPLSDRLGRRKPVVILTTVLAAIGLLFPMLWPSATSMIVFWTIGGLGMGAYFAVDLALVVQLLPNKATQAKDLGVLNMANTGGQILAPAVSALIVTLAGSTGGSYRYLFIVAIVFMIAAAAAIVPIKRAR